MRGIECLRCEHREDMGVKIVGHPAPCFAGDFIIFEHINFSSGQRSAQFCPNPLLFTHERIGTSGDGGELLIRRHAIGRSHFHALELLAFEARHPDHEKFIKIVTRN